MKYTVKKIVSFVLCLALALGALAVPALAASDLLGDVDTDKNVTTKDARLALRAAIGLDTLSGKATAAADVTGDGSVKTDDARIILRVAIGLMRLSADGKRYEDLPKPGDVLAEFIVKNGDVYEGVYGLEYENDVGDTISFGYNESTGLFHIIVHEIYDDFEAVYTASFNKSFSDYRTQAVVYDSEIVYALGEYKMDPANLNWNTGSDCFTETSYDGDPSTKADLVYALSGNMCVAFGLLLKEAQAAGYKITHNDMHLYRLMEPYQG